MIKKQNKKFIRVTYNDIGHYVQEADTLEQFKANFVKEFKLDQKNKIFCLKCKDSAHRVTKIEKDETFKKYKNYMVKYPKLIHPFFTSEEKVIHKNQICSECGISPIEGIMYKCLSCKKYDLCQNCEKIYGEKHGHNFLMLRKEEYLKDFEKICIEKLFNK